MTISNREEIRRAGLGLVGAALDVLSLSSDDMARPTGPVTIRHAIEVVTEATAGMERLCADRLDEVVGYREPEPRKPRARERRARGAR